MFAVTLNSLEFVLLGVHYRQKDTGFFVTKHNRACFEWTSVCSTCYAFFKKCYDFLSFTSEQQPRSLVLAVVAKTGAAQSFSDSHQLYDHIITETPV